MVKNIHGLGRYIPAEVKREIRLKSGFGCVICGLGIVSYEHVDPEFYQAKVHDPKKMTLLCIGCHGKVTSRFWSKEKIKKAMLNPKALQQGFSNEFFDIGDEWPIIKFGGSTFTQCPKLIVVAGECILGVKPPYKGEGNFLIDGLFNSPDGSQSLTISNNEWISSSINWDLTVVGRRLTIKQVSGKISLQILVEPPTTLIIEKVEMYINGWSISGNEKELIFKNSNGFSNTFTNCFASNCQVGMSFG